jgi:uncharacterized protein (DUF433 family)
VVVPARPGPAQLSFSNLVECFVLSALRRKHEIPLQRIRAAVSYVQRELNDPRPLIHKTFQTAGKELFVEHMGQVLNASRGGQPMLLNAIDLRLQRIDWDEAGIAEKLFPIARSNVAESQPRSILITPRLGFGRPVLAGTGIRVEVVTSRYRAGERASELAEDYGVDRELIDDAIRIEMREAA